MVEKNFGVFCVLQVHTDGWFDNKPIKDVGQDYERDAQGQATLAISRSLCKE